MSEPASACQEKDVRAFPKLKIGIYGEGPHPTFAKALLRDLQRSGADRYFELALVSDINPAFVARYASEGIPEEICEVRDATLSRSFFGVHVAIFVCLYGSSPRDTKLLHKSVAGALNDARTVLFACLVGRHQVGGPEAFGHPALYKPFADEFRLLDARRNISGQPLIEGYKHYFTANGERRDFILEDGWFGGNEVFSHISAFAVHFDWAIRDYPYVINTFDPETFPAHEHAPGFLLRVIATYYWDRKLYDDFGMAGTLTGIALHLTLVQHVRKASSVGLRGCWGDPDYSLIWV